MVFCHAGIGPQRDYSQRGARTGSISGLRAARQLIIDKITTVSRTKRARHLGRLSDEDIVRVNRAVMVFLGLAGLKRDRSGGEETR